MLKSTEIVIEQLIIGLLFIVIVVMFAWGNPLPLFKSESGASQSFFYGVLVIIAAYAAGIVVDRWSDTLLEQLERIIRIKVYLKNLTYQQLNPSIIASLPAEPLLRLEIRKKGEGISDYHDYLRRRMRITRALTCLMPALFLALALLDYQCISQEVVRWTAGIITFALYAAILVYGIILPKKHQVPKTHDKKKLMNYVGGHRRNKLLNHDKISIGFRFGDLTNPALLGLMLFAVFEIVLLIILYLKFSPTNSLKIFLFMVGGVVVACLVGWAWWRICKTFFTLLLNYHQLGKENEQRHLFYT